jgi:DNA-binding transcriptional regulator YdaS (Cro superfamily)
MQFKPYFFAMTKDERAAFAKRVGTTVGHLNNFCYGYTKLAPDVCVSIEQASDGIVMRWDLRPDDWFRIWPELIGTKGAPEVPKDYVPAAKVVTENVAEGA